MFVFNDVKVAAVKNHILDNFPTFPEKIVSNILQYVAAQGMDLEETLDLILVFFDGHSLRRSELSFLLTYGRNYYSKYYSFSEKDTESFITSGLFAETLDAPISDIETLNHIIDKISEKLMSYDEQSHVMSYFNVVNKEKIVSILKEAGVLDGNQIDREKMESFTIPSIPSNFDRNDYDNLMNHDMESIKKIFRCLYHIGMTQGAWAAHVDAIEYKDVWNLYDEVMEVLKGWDNLVLPEMSKVKTYLDEHDWSIPKELVSQNEMMVSTLAKGLIEIKNRCNIKAKYYNQELGIDGTIS